MNSIGRIERVDQRTGKLANLDVVLADAACVANASAQWRPDPSLGSLAGAQFNWQAVIGFWPERHVLYATCDGFRFALMQLDDDYGPLRSRRWRAIYISFLEVAPQVRVGSWERRFIGLGAAMLTFAVARSRQLGFDGRIGLHSVMQARDFYAKLGFRELAAPGPNEYWETYMELSPQAANGLMGQSSGT